MKKETKTIAEYKAPKCKVVGVHVQNLVCASPYGDDGQPGSDVPVEYDDYDY